MSGPRKLTLAVAVVLLTAASPRPAVSLARNAPQFSLPDLAGRRLSLSSLRGHIVIVNFWATWCEPCMFEIPGLAAFWRQHHSRCLEVLGIAEDFDDQYIVAGAATHLQIPYPVLLDSDGLVADSYHVPGYPITYVIDARGKVRRVFDGVVTEKELEAVVTPLLPVSPGTCPTR